MKGIEFYKKRGFEDASRWLRILQFHGIKPCDVSKKELGEAIDFYFNESFKNDSPEINSNDELKNSYKNAFLSRINNIWKSAGEQITSDNDEKVLDFEKKGQVAAMRWLMSVEDQYAQNLTEEELVELADTIFKIKYFSEKDTNVKIAFVNSFVKEVTLLISTVD